jgi:hypothetical protein
MKVPGDQLAEQIFQRTELVAAVAVELGAHVEHVPSP